MKGLVDRMRVALHNPFGPDRPTAEGELAGRMVIAGSRMGWTMRVVHSSTEVEDFSPDLVVSLHGEAPKSTEHPTVGCLWNPPAHVEDHPMALARVLSYDGFLTAGSGMERFVETLLFSTRRPVRTAPVYPTTHAMAMPSQVRQDSRLFYVGSNWDGRRFERLFDRLAAAGVLAAYGPTERWNYLRNGYAGSLAFDGTALLDAANRCGVGLCLHLPGHTASGLPNMRIFELAAAGALIICGRHPFIEEHFGDCVLTVDADAPVEAVADTIIGHVHWARANPEAANAFAARSQSIFLERFTLERLMAHWPTLLAAVRQSCGFLPRSGASAQYVLPVSGAPLNAVRRTIMSVIAQSHQPVGLILVGDAASLEQAKLLTDNANVTRLLALPDDAPPGAALWAGLREADASWVGVAEAGVQLFPNHVASLLDAACREGVDLVFAHAILEQQGEQTLTPLDVLRRFELPGDRMALPPSAFLANRGLLDDRLLRDPGLENQAAALYLVRRLAAKAAIGAGVASSWLTTLRDDARPLGLRQRQDIDRLERFDPTRPPPPAATDSDRPRPAPPGDVGAAALDGVPILHTPQDFKALDPTLPVRIFGTGRGGRFVQLELMAHPGIKIVGFLDSRTSGMAWGLPVHRLADLSPDLLAMTTVIIASQHVVEILALLKGIRPASLFNAYPYILARTEL